MERPKGLLVINFGKVGLVCNFIYGIGFYLEEINERGNKEGGSGRKSKRDRGLSAKRPCPSSRTKQGQGGSTGRPANRGTHRRLSLLISRAFKKQWRR
jgi:hypothetical protein